MAECKTCNYRDDDVCEHPELESEWEFIPKRIQIDGGRPHWCPKDPDEVQNNKTKKGARTMNEKRNFNFDTAQVKGNALNALDITKNAIIQLQQGKAVLTAVKAGLKKAPGVPDNMKLLLDTPYGDLVVGLILHTVAPVLTGSPTIIKAVKAANVAGAAEISHKMTFIQDVIEQAIGSIPGFGDIQQMVSSSKMATPQPDAPTEE